MESLYINRLYPAEEEGNALSSIKALIVIYNKPLLECLTLRSIEGVKDVDIYIADNSTGDYKNAAYANERGYQYYGMGGNMGLSKAYNRVISGLEKDENIICLFDDDTRVNNSYFEELRKDAEQYRDIHVFAPVVKDRKGILSPCKFDGAKGIRVKNIDRIPERGISVINSGLAVRLRVFRDYKYDEGQFLDYIDHAFIKDVINNEKSKIHIMNAAIDQNFSASGISNAEADKERFKIFKKDFEYFCVKYGVPPICRRMVLLKRKSALLLRRLFR
jgi:hypothetical protein